MIKLSGHSLTPGVKFTPESQKLDLTERTSTSSFTLPISSGVSLAVGDWLLDDTDPGAGIVWRVKANEATYNTNTRLITLEHIINTLADQSVFGEVTASDISGGSTCTAQEAFEYFLDKQSIWELGTFEYNVSQPFTFNGETLLSALETISSALDNPMWEFDMSSMPFKISVKQKPTDPDSEMRAGRNLATLRKSEDRSKMFTRVYPIGKQNMHITGNYISKNENLYGRVDKVLTDQSQETEAALRAWAADKLNRHAQPTVNITISGLDFYEATGESLDRLRINHVCRVPLPEYGTTILEPIVKLSYRDKIKEPENVTVTLCNNIEDVATFMKEQDAAGGRGGRASAKEAQEDHAWFVDTESHVGMVAEAIIGRDPTTGEVNWSRVAEIIVDGSGIHQQVVRAEGSIVTMYGRQDMTESSLTTVFSTVSGLQGSMVMTAESLTTVYTKTGIDSLGQSETLYSKINQTASLISLKVSKGDVATQLAVEAGNVSITGGNLVVDGMITAADLEIYEGFIGSVNTAGINCEGSASVMDDLTCGAVYTGEIYLGENEYGEHTFTVDGTQLATFLGSDDINFNVADTQTYRNGVSAVINSLTAASGDTPAEADVTVSSNNPRMSNTKTLTIATDGWVAAGTNTVRIKDGNTSLASVAVQMPGMSGEWTGSTGSSATTSNTYKVNEKVGSTIIGAATGHQVNIYLTQGTRSGNTLPIYVRTESTSGTIVAKDTVTVSGGGGTVDSIAINGTVTDGSTSTAVKLNVPVSAYDAQDQVLKSATLTPVVPPSIYTPTVSITISSVRRTGGQWLDVTATATATTANGLGTTTETGTYARYLGNWLNEAKAEGAAEVTLTRQTWADQSIPSDAHYVYTVDPGHNRKFTVNASNGQSLTGYFKGGTQTITVSDWERTNFTSSTNNYGTGGRELSIPVSVKVNGTKYSHTFTTGGFRVVKQSSTMYMIYCGNTELGVWTP